MLDKRNDDKNQLYNPNVWDVYVSYDDGDSKTIKCSSRREAVAKVEELVTRK